MRHFYPLQGELHLAPRALERSKGYPALMVTDTAFYRYAHYYRASDAPETLDYGHMTRANGGRPGAGQADHD